MTIDWTGNPAYPCREQGQSSQTAPARLLPSNTAVDRRIPPPYSALRRAPGAGPWRGAISEPFALLMTIYGPAIRVSAWICWECVMDLPGQCAELRTELATALEAERDMSETTP